MQKPKGHFLSYGTERQEARHRDHLDGRGLRKMVHRYRKESRSHRLLQR